MKNFVQNGKKLTLTAPYDRLSGQGALVGFLFGVAIVDVVSGSDADFEVEGVYDLAKTAADTFTVGAKVYWDNTAKSCTSTATANTLIGCATAAAAGADATVRVRLNPQV